jgi:hypothetical protein
MIGSYSLVAIFMATFIFTLWFFWLRYVHVGYGLLLARRHDGTVWVVDCLQHSPAWSAGVRAGMQIIFVNNRVMKFFDDTHFKLWEQKQILHPKSSEYFEFHGGLSVHLRPVIIWNTKHKTKSPHRVVQEKTIHRMSTMFLVR